eukprot:TRINITY_DN1378_c0_g1_i2.p1 TRINITY_DN1378_c0_g1~~TRINITY_DN1378_c0_g1_i2.p1  ORF type:complete len:281 (+),score=47.21 TRINITY_DN1378_c0_g1_i2:55-897(+)
MSDPSHQEDKKNQGAEGAPAPDVGAPAAATSTGATEAPAAEAPAAEAPAAEASGPSPPGLAGLAKDMVESDAAFRAQFDRSNPTYHGGLAESVPVNPSAEAAPGAVFGGGRIPESMGGGILGAGAAAAGATSASAASGEFGPEVDFLMAARSTLGELKASLTAVGPALDAVVKSKAGGDAASDDAMRGLEAAIAKAQGHGDAIRRAGEGLSGSAAAAVNAARWTSAVEAVCAMARDPKSQTKDGYGEFLVSLKPHTAAIFNAQKALLQEIKAAKVRFTKA